MAKALPPISSLRAFEAAARHMNFTRAAKELAITQAAVSYQIRLLEERLGAPLFIREPRRLLLTDRGEQLAIPIREAFDRLRATFENFHDETRSVLSLSAAETFAANWLVPRLGEFQLQNPSIAVRVLASDTLADFSKDKFDAAIRVGGGKWPALACHKLFPVYVTPMCTPSLLSRLGRPRKPGDLLRMPLISPDELSWKIWFTAAGLRNVELGSRDGPNLGVQILEGKAALADQGVAILSPNLFVSELQSGRLVRLFDLIADGGRAYWLVYPKHHSAMTKVRAFQSWIMSQAAADRAAMRKLHASRAAP